jgi:AcrR family transcriptional regulator
VDLGGARTTVVDRATVDPAVMDRAIVDPAMVDRAIVDRTAARSLADRHSEYVVEIERIIDATYRVIERTGHVEPTMREILREAKLSTPAFYRHFRSKDELFVVLLEDGRRRLAATTARRMAREATGVGRLRAWIDAVLAQGRDVAAAARTRPFMAGLDRLVERYPDEHRASEALLIDQLVDAIVRSDDLVSADPRADAASIYHLTFGVLGWHLRNRSTPLPADVDHLVAFARRALTATTPERTNECT